MNRPLKRELVFQLVDTARLLRTHIDQQARRHGTTRAQWSVLARLRRGDGQTQVGLADAMEMQPISLGRLIDKLEAQAFVERRPDPKDRRAYRLHITQAGRSFVDGLDALRQDIADEVVPEEHEAAIAAALSVLTGIRERVHLAATDPREDFAGPARPPVLHDALPTA
ncbi:MarR family transcriptional regulator [Bosea caraganae]|uniref:MarR family transcriptional regulator n=1 Tax=Bosea caraganae TaxID=2763117 RepID=A0A370L7S5_9HYPH|nr:MarR family transcriptional regulator [Bosea caraganae]RDJ24986.1 MarR family transcriptional regulator [Bosea caraganae]RDJ26096.1 MarR family transcriptional regulator [Bosea caraganae]